MFIIFYDLYLETLKVKTYIEKRIKSKVDKQTE